MAKKEQKHLLKLSKKKNNNNSNLLNRLKLSIGSNRHFLRIYVFPRLGIQIHPSFALQVKHSCTVQLLLMPSPRHVLDWHWFFMNEFQGILIYDSCFQPMDFSGAFERTHQMVRCKTVNASQYGTMRTPSNFENEICEKVANCLLTRMTQMQFFGQFWECSDFQPLERAFSLP